MAGHLFRIYENNKDLVFNGGGATSQQGVIKAVPCDNAAVLVGTKPLGSDRFDSGGGSPVAAGVDAVLPARN